MCIRLNERDEAISDEIRRNSKRLMSIGALTMIAFLATPLAQVDVFQIGSAEGSKLIGFCVGFLLTLTGRIIYMFDPKDGPDPEDRKGFIPQPLYPWQMGGAVYTGKPEPVPDQAVLYVASAVIPDSESDWVYDVQEQHLYQPPKEPQ